MSNHNNKFCSACGSELEVMQGYCGNCGNKITDSAEDPREKTTKQTNNKRKTFIFIAFVITLVCLVSAFIVFRLIGKTTQRSSLIGVWSNVGTSSVDSDRLSTVEFTQSGLIKYDNVTAGRWEIVGEGELRFCDLMNQDDCNEDFDINYYFNGDYLIIDFDYKTMRLKRID
jgi:predicted RNA-binding Zn-ribbon protein involved in translation (DUF1610 family)